VPIKISRLTIQSGNRLELCLIYLEYFFEDGGQQNETAANGMGTRS
jgi:hypothetical protein